MRMYVKLYGEIIMSELLKGTSLSLSNDPLMQIVPERVTTDRLLQQLSLWYVHPNRSLPNVALPLICTLSLCSHSDFYLLLLKLTLLLRCYCLIQIQNSCVVALVNFW